MATKTFELTGIGKVRCVKRRGARKMRISIDYEGNVRLSLPYWVPYSRGQRFLLAQQAWIKKRLPPPSLPLLHNMRIGKSHRLKFVACEIEKARGRVRDNQIIVEHPAHTQSGDHIVQTAAKAAAIKALRKEAQTLLPLKLADLSRKTGLKYTSVSFKQMRRRWGSCSSDRKLVLNIFLMQLPWHLIDYVLLHELTHIEVLNHGPDFWKKLEDHLPQTRSLRKEIRQYHPTLA